MEVVFYKVTMNADLVNTEILRGNTGLWSYKPLVMTFPTTFQYIASFYMFLFKDNLTSIVDSSTMNS